MGKIIYSEDELNEELEFTCNPLHLSHVNRKNAVCNTTFSAPLKELRSVFSMVHHNLAYAVCPKCGNVLLRRITPRQHSILCSLKTLNALKSKENSDRNR